MSHDLFSDVLVAPSTARARRRSLILVSVVVHAAAVIGVVAVSIVAPDALPTPARAMAFFDPRDVMPLDIPLPPPPRTQRQNSDEAAKTIIDHGISVLPPTGISDEPVALPTIRGPELEGVEGGGWRGDHGLNALGPSLEPPPPPQPVAQPPIHLHSGVQAPRKIATVPPVYPQAARMARIEGIVILEVVIGIDGRVTSSRVLRSVPMLDQAALDAVRQWVYTPALLNGTAVPVIMTLTVNFTLAR